MEATLIDSMGSDLSVVNAARVSFHKESTWEVCSNECHCNAWYEHECACGNFTPKVKLSDKDIKLINYLAKHKHFSPFNHAFLTFRVKAPIFVARQLVKHKFMPWNEVSRRYVDEEPEFYFPDVWRQSAENVKQGSGGVHPEQSPEFSDTFIHVNPATVTLDALCLYTQMIKDGYAAEQARMILPQNTMTEWIWSGTLGAYCDMLRLRLDPHTQQESREIAQMIYTQIEEKFPVSVKALLHD